MLVYQRVATGAVLVQCLVGLEPSELRQALNGREKCLKAGAESVPDTQAPLRKAYPLVTTNSLRTGKSLYLMEQSTISMVIFNTDGIFNTKDGIFPDLPRSSQVSVDGKIPSFWGSHAAKVGLHFRGGAGAIDRARTNSKWDWLICDSQYSTVKSCGDIFNSAGTSWLSCAMFDQGWEIPFVWS